MRGDTRTRTFGVLSAVFAFGSSALLIGSAVPVHAGVSAGTKPAATGVSNGGDVPLVIRLKGLDVSSYQGNVNWPAVKAAGAKFAYVKATEGTYYTNPYFAQQYNGSYSVGLIRGAYHFATPDTTSGPTQADFFVAHGGGWSRDGKTLPPMLDIEYNPYGPTCYGLSQSAMAAWIQSFSDEIHARTSRYPTIYSTTNWWITCTGNYGGLGATNPLFIACYCSGPGTLPAGWAFWTFWQFSNSGTFPGDQDYFNGSYTRLVKLATG